MLGLASIWYLYIVATTNPGYLARNDSCFTRGEVVSHRAIQETPCSQTSILVPFRGKQYMMRLCRTCFLVRPPRSSHCGVCNLCVEKYDHHCPWVGNCIGKNNYRFFLSFLYSTTALLVFCFVLSVSHLSEKKKYEGFVEIIEESGVLLVVNFFILVIGWFLLGLTLFHTWLLFRNITTREYIKSLWKNKYSCTFSRGCYRNLIDVFFSEKHRDWFKFHHHVSTVLNNRMPVSSNAVQKVHGEDDAEKNIDYKSYSSNRKELGMSFSQHEYDGEHSILF